jgi:DNA primase
MGKVSPVSIKYVIHAKFLATGAIEKPDVIGAIFGQTEGLLGRDLELRELQKEGKIGRIDVELETKDGNTTGIIDIPSSLDKTETTIIAAALETIERIGPSDAKIEITDIEDLRSSKREYIINRAKKLLEQVNTKLPESQEIEDAVVASSRLSKIQEFGKERLPAGNLNSEEIIVVEGRADVVNLVRHGVENVIGMNGTVLPKTIKELSDSKKLTLFLDGDRGGMLIAKNVIANAKIDFITFAPSGKEVEELSSKEIITALRKKITPEQLIRESRTRKRNRNNFDIRKSRRKKTRKGYKKIESKTENAATRGLKEPVEPIALSENEKEIFQSNFYDLIGTRGACILDSKLNVLEKVPISELSKALNNLKNKVYALILDGTATPYIIKLAERTTCKHLVARNFASYRTNINLVSL